MKKQRLSLLFHANKLHLSATVAAMEVHAVTQHELFPDPSTMAVVAQLQLPGQFLVISTVFPLRALLMNLPGSPI
jgi:hypothetical protein